MRSALGALALLAIGLCATPALATTVDLPCNQSIPPANTPVEQVEQVLGTLHFCAARGEGESYFSLFTPDAVFIGTDVSERWTLVQFRAYAEPIFGQGRGWTYTLRPGTRHVILAPDRRTAWFDEVLDSASYGTSRGTGVLVLTPQGWRIAQYHLTFPIPNELAGEFTRRIREHEGRAAEAR